MLNFGGFLTTGFWNSYRCQTSQSIEDLLNSKDCTVDKLLEDDDCLQEFKNFNDKLIKYFNHERMKTLVDYITVMPDADAGYNRGRKYPFITGEIFNCEITQIMDKFFEPPAKALPADEKDEEEDDKRSSDGSEPGKQLSDDDDSDGDNILIEKKGGQGTQGETPNEEEEEKDKEKEKAGDEEKKDEPSDKKDADDKDQVQVEAAEAEEDKTAEPAKDETNPQADKPEAEKADADKPVEQNSQEPEAEEGDLKDAPALQRQDTPATAEI